MRKSREFNRWVAQFPDPLYKQVLTCSASVTSELLASLDFYSEIKTAGKDLLRANGHQDLGNAFLQLQAYVRQAKTFYEAADALHHRASPLNYYYSFMNLAKAIVFLRTPGFVDQKLTHGLTPKDVSGSLRKQKIIAKPAGVFPMFYSKIMKRPVAHNASLKLTDLLGYASDVGYEYGLLRYGPVRSTHGKMAFCINKITQKWFVTLALSGAKHIEFKYLQRKLEKSFEQIEISEHAIREIFKMDGPERGASLFFESRKEFDFSTPYKAGVDYVVEATDGFMSQNPFNDNRLFVLQNPIKTPRLTGMNEMMAIYCIMFFLGSLVRYRPDRLEAMLLTKDAWLIERFTKAAPTTFLRHARNAFDGKYLVYSSR